MLEFADELLMVQNVKKFNDFESNQMLLKVCFVFFFCGNKIAYFSHLVCLP